MLAVSDFSKNALTFCNDNMLVMGFAGFNDTHVTPADGVENFQFKLMPPDRAKGSQLGRKMPVYQIIPASKPGPGTIRAYWCPYAQNNTLGVMVGGAADFMFTATMDGCTLGVGSTNADGSCMVYHANNASFGSATDKTSQGEAQATTLNLMFGASPHTQYGPLDYRVEAGQYHLSSTTFGVRARDTGKWHFYSQIYDKNPTASGLTNYYFRKIKVFS